MARVNKTISFDEALQQLRSAGFTVQAAAGAAGRWDVSKHGCAITLLRAEDGSVACADHAACIVAGERAPLVDHGYQKFLRALHTFTEELHAAAGTPSLYNESLGTVSDLYLYDRLKGREAASQTGNAANGH
jgi:putative intracellular protease/amidase